MALIEFMSAHAERFWYVCIDYFIRHLVTILDTPLAAAELISIGLTASDWRSLLCADAPALNSAALYDSLMSARFRHCSLPTR